MSRADSYGMAVKNQGPEKVTASAFEARVTASVGTGREVMLGSTANASSSAHTFEGRASQETGTH